MIIRAAGGSRPLFLDGLPGCLAAQAREDISAYPALRPHQRQPWHAFCVQVATLALVHAGERRLPEREEDWRTLLLALTPDWPAGEAWSLTVDDWAKPALLQPPIAEPSNVRDYKGRIETPDALDMLVTAKNHDLKAARLAVAADDDWLFALVTLQTYEGFMGAGNFGISRMNGGFGSRTAFGVRPEGGIGAAFRRDVVRLLAERSAIAEESAAKGSMALMWLAAWDGTRQLRFADLDPLYVDVCRRVRLRRDASDRLSAWTASSKVARVAADGLNGRTGDPWAPALAQLPKSYTPTVAGFGYRQMARLLNPTEMRLPPLGRVSAEDADRGLAFVASAVVRGQGKTEGFHERRVPVSRRMRGLFGSNPQAMDRTGEVASVRARAAGEVGRILERALHSLHQAGPLQPRFDDKTAERRFRRWVDRYDAEIDARFFDEAFWEDVATPAGEKTFRPLWRGWLVDCARTILEAAGDAAPRTAMRRVRAQARARNLFDASARKYLESAAHAD
jgi:CRISPR system Cascade subunit CasA